MVSILILEEMARMADYDEEHQKLTIKVVFYGPALSGKTSNLTYLHRALNPELKGDMMVLETKHDRTLFFDLLPLGLTTPSGLLIKLKVFTVPGQVAHDSTRKAVLSRADGVVFVADSQNSQGRNNLESFENLIANIGRVGLDIDHLPLIVQFNKRDLPDIVTEEDVLARWSKSPWPVHFSSALTGEGILETFTGLLEKLYQHMDELWQLSTTHQLSKESFVQKIALNT